MSINFYTTNAYNQYPQLQKDIKDAKANADSVDNVDTKIEKAALGSIPVFRRGLSLPDKFASGDTVAAVGATALLVANLPEDCRDIKSAFNQGKTILNGQKFTPKYDYTKYQHDFSFFKGTLFENWAQNTKNEKVKNTLNNLYQKDVSIYHTNLGEKVKKFLGITSGEAIETTAKDRFGNNAIVTEIKAPSAFAELTGRAMKRTTKLGVCALALLELPKIFKATNQGNTIGENTENTGKQIVKSGINLASVTAGIAYGGAFGAKKFGSIGSLVGMGIGAVVGATASKKIQDII